MTSTPTLAQIADAVTAPDVKPATVRPEPDSRLDQLSAQYDLVKAEAEKAAGALKAVTDAIKLELSQLAPDATSVDLDSDHLARPLRLNAVTSWRVDANKLKAEDPETYVRYAKQSTAWTLKQVNR